ncbi:MAG TPA: MotA/TolQ/ExbB proton channel family protein [Bryobacteraceae bacterium]|nr:MotA/TolQ/ExbB proton channel family protein [Bryobacteraceae bacterium]
MPYVGALIQMSIWELVLGASLLSKIVLLILFVASVLSWTMILAKWSQFRSGVDANAAFLRAFRKAPNLESVAVVAEQFRNAPVTVVFDFGYQEVARQARTKGGIVNKSALERSLQLGISEESARLERNMSWLATTATVSPFVGLFGTVLGIIDAFTGLGAAGSASLRAVAPGISEALIATAAGLAAAIPAAIAYNQFGHRIRELMARMDDFSLEFLNMTERTFEE